MEDAITHRILLQEFPFHPFTVWISVSQLLECVSPACQRIVNRGFFLCQLSKQIVKTFVIS